MQSGQPSRTAFAAATHRAVHQVLEKGNIFRDPLALRILGRADGEPIAGEHEQPSRRRMRLFIAIRTRFAEDALAAAVERGLSQLVVLGAGLDTFAYRNPFADKLRVFEVDFPATQAWKRERLAEASIAIPHSLTFAPVDFENETLAAGLEAAGFDSSRPAFFTWLGVVPYLSEDAVWSTLRFIASLPKPSHVVFDYGNPPDSLPEHLRADHVERAARVASLGEAFKTSFETPDLHAKLNTLGFSAIDDMGPVSIVARYSTGRPVPATDHGGHIAHAATRWS